MIPVILRAYLTIYQLVFIFHMPSFDKIHCRQMYIRNLKFEDSGIYTCCDRVSDLKVCPSTLFWWSVSRLWLRGLMSDLLNMTAMSSGMTKFIFKSF